MKIISLAGARPNFMKIAPIIHALENRTVDKKTRPIEHILVHSGQHYDFLMSEVFFNQLNIRPDIFLESGSGTHAEQTAKVMVAFEKVCHEQKPDLVVVVGDVNTTLAGALVAAKSHIPLAHIEAGLRSFDRSMPEEINRVLTDAVSDLLFTTEQSADENLLREGIPSHKIFFVGNVMIDCLHLFGNDSNSELLQLYGLSEKSYGVITLHRPENVDHVDRLRELFSILESLQKEARLIFPVHPRLTSKLADLKDEFGSSNLQLIGPLGYLEFMTLMKSAAFVITDSGGIQEETTALNVPCITVRKNTERPITVTSGTNVITGIDSTAILKYSKQAIRGEWKKGSMPPLWDGKAAERIVDILMDQFLLKGER